MKLSVITICYNDPKLILTCRSIVEQTDWDFEWIVVDGGSNFQTQSILSEFRSAMSRFVSEPDNGRYDAMNKGVLLATGDYLVFMNAGDRFASSDTVARLKSFIDKEDSADVYYANGVLEGRDRRYFLIEKPSHLTIEYLYSMSLFHQAMAIRRTAFIECGLYDVSLKIVADWKHYVMMFRRGYRFQHLPFVMAIDDDQGISNTPNQRQERSRVLRSLFTVEECRCIIQRIVNDRMGDFLSGRRAQLRKL